MSPPHTPWDGAERRRLDATSTEPILSHIDKRFDEMETLIRSGFPDGDIEGHRRAHETVIESAAGRAKLWSTVLEKTISGSVWAAIVLLAMALWEYVKGKIRL